MDKSCIRNFCIIAHIDHGKSTLADRFIQKADIISDRDFYNQMLDSMDIERERGITIKSQAVSLPLCINAQDYLLNLVDTPGHVDFSYEVSRAISSCEGAVLLIDASQGVEAQTFSTLYMAFEHGLEIIPVINKVDLPTAEIDRCMHQIEHDLGLNPEGAVLVSAKTGKGVDSLLENLVQRIPHPKGDKTHPLQALVFDSSYDSYRGVIVYTRIIEGTVMPGDTIKLCAGNMQYVVEDVGHFMIGLQKTLKLEAGEVGYIIAGIKAVQDVQVGDTITHLEKPCKKALPGFREVKPVVFSSIYPVNSNMYEDLLQALKKLQLNDASLVYHHCAMPTLGSGFHCGFLGMLHLEVVQERLVREFNLDLVLTVPSVEYKVEMKDNTIRFIGNPLEFPDPSDFSSVSEPYIQAMIITPHEYLGAVMQLCSNRRGIQKNMIYLDESRVEITFEIPLAEIFYQFYDTLKSLSRGYASFDYEMLDYRSVDLVRLDILVNGKPVDALSMLVFRGFARDRAVGACKRLKAEIPRHQFKVPIQGAVGGTIIARETVSPVRKDVTAKLYGGDITRKRKLLEKQKKGKKRLMRFGNVEVPQSAFLAVLRGGQE